DIAAACWCSVRTLRSNNWRRRLRLRRGIRSAAGSRSDARSSETPRGPGLPVISTTRPSSSRGRLVTARWSSCCSTRASRVRLRRTALLIRLTADKAMARIGFIGVGLMGHGMAKHLLAKGHPLTLKAHRNRANLADLLAAGAREVQTLADVGAASD